MAVKEWNKERTPAVLKNWEGRCNSDSNSSSVSNIEEQNIHDDTNVDDCVIDGVVVVIGDISIFVDGVFVVFV